MVKNSSSKNTVYACLIIEGIGGLLPTKYILKESVCVVVFFHWCSRRFFQEEIKIQVLVT